MSRVVVITTGGTIASSSDTAGVGRPTRTGRDLLAGLDATADVDVVDLLAVDSSQLTPADWDRISTAITAAVDAGADGVVVTHGTDTLEETALWLDATYTGSAPVVLTGAMRSSDDPEPDGPRNLAEAVSAAASPSTRDVGVLVCFAGTVWQPLGLTKTGARWTGTALGSVTPGAVLLNRTKRRPLLGAAKAAIAPRVDVVAVYAGADAVAMHAHVAAGATALVLEALGAGNAPGEVVRGVERLCADGVVVAVSSRVPDAVVSARYGPGRALADAGAIAVPTVRPAQARVLLMAALAVGSPVAAVLAEWG